MSVLRARPTNRQLSSHRGDHCARGLLGFKHAAQNVSAGVIVRYQVFQIENEAAGIAYVAVTTDGLQVFCHAIGRKTVSTKDLYLFMAGGQGFLFEHTELLVELFTGTRTAEL